MTNTDDMTYIVNISSGLTSFEAGRRAVMKYGKEHVVWVFADVKGANPSPHAGEDEDNYRFLRETAAYVDAPLVWLKHPLGWDIWDAMRSARAITIMTGSGFAAPCSRILKRDLIDAWIAEQYAGKPITRVFGYEWSEIDRMVGLQETLNGVPVWFPLADPPYVDKCHIAAFLESIGIKPPRLYDDGFSHANCGGGCVKAGQAHWANLWRTNLERYLYWEAKEADMVAFLEKTVTILRDRRGGKTRPMTLTEFRERLERGEAYDADDWGGCGILSRVVYCLGLAAGCRCSFFLPFSKVALYSVG